MARSPLAQLACGRPSGSGALSETLNNIGSNIDKYYSVASDFINGRRKSLISEFGPYLGRIMIELSSTAILARIDPFRVLVVRKIQEQPDFDLNLSIPSRIEWAGDIIGNNSPKGGGQASDSSKIWSVTAKKDGFSRALLSETFSEIYWRPAVENFIDSSTEIDKFTLISEIHRIDPEKFVTSIRGRAMQLYPSLSKGVHGEVLLPIETLYDTSTVQESLRESIQLVAKLGLVSHWIEVSQYKIPQSRVLRNLENMKGLIND
ncbi:MAG: hypothetical protein RID91_07070 [Azospirillaceae bacterium]